ncbi:MAG TPA: hypothetical protein VFE46_09835 [Pirellulales bacterium]|nr:hypothetical protein [Pirellulales bacterium]
MIPHRPQQVPFERRLFAGWLFEGRQFERRQRKSPARSNRGPQGKSTAAGK